MAEKLGATSPSQEHTYDESCITHRAVFVGSICRPFGVGRARPLRVSRAAKDEGAGRSTRAESEGTNSEQRTRSQLKLEYEKAAVEHLAAVEHQKEEQCEKNS